MSKSFFSLLTFLWYTTSIHSTSFIKKWKAPRKRKPLVITQDKECVKQAKFAICKLYTINDLYLAEPQNGSMKQILSEQAPCTEEQRELLNDILAHLNTKKQLFPQCLQKQILPNEDDEWNIFQVLQVLLSYRKDFRGNSYEYITKKGWKPEQLKAISGTIIRHLQYNRGVIQSLYALKLITPFKQVMGAYAKYLPVSPLYNEINIHAMYLILDHEARQYFPHHSSQKLIPREIGQIIYTYFYNDDDAQISFSNIQLLRNKEIHYFKYKYPNKMFEYIKNTTFPPCIYKGKSAILYWKRDKDDLRDEVFYLYGANLYDTLCFFRSKKYRTVKEAIDDGWMLLLLQLGVHLERIVDKCIAQNQDALNPILYTETEERDLPSLGYT